MNIHFLPTFLRRIQTYRSVHVITWFLSIIIILGPFGNTEGAPKMEEPIKSILTSLPSDSLFPSSYTKPFLKAQIDSFYRARNFSPAWFDSKNRALPTLDSLLQGIRSVYDEGLNPNEYHLLSMSSNHMGISFRSIRIPDSRKAKLRYDVRATAAYLMLASHLYSGRIDPAHVNSRWVTESTTTAFDSILSGALKTNTITRSLHELSPPDPQYRFLKAALRRYRTIAKEGGWPEVARVDSLVQKGDSGNVVLAIEKRLLKEGDLHRKPTGKYDHAVAQAVISYQIRHDLQTDGIVGDEVFSSFETPVTLQIQRIIINLDRLRWSRRGDLSGRFLTVNIPEFMLRAWDTNRKVMQMKVIVGREFDATPIFNDRLEYIVFNPSWTLPRNIVREEIWPKLKQDTVTFPLDSFRVFENWTDDAGEIATDTVDWSKLDRDAINTLKFVQHPGPTNPLGRIKFMMPNNLSIYLHDTPSTYLFNSEEREFSHGCIRVERPVDLAYWLLLPSIEWDRERISMAMDSTVTDTVGLPENVPVYIQYHTVIFNEQGIFCFKNDIYKHDDAHIRALEIINFWRTLGLG